MKISELTKEKFIEQIKNKYSICSHGVIYKANTGFSAELNECVKINESGKIAQAGEEYELYSKTKYIEEGSFFEFRYEYDAHCRDIDNEYWRIDSSILAIKCEPFAQILESVRFENKLNLKEILEQELYQLTTFKKGV